MNIIVMKGEITMTFEKDILNVTETAYYLSCSQQKIYSLIKNGNLEAYKDAGQNGRRGRNWKITAFSVGYYLRSMIHMYDQQKSQVTKEKKEPHNQCGSKTVRKIFIDKEDEHV